MSVQWKLMASFILIVVVMGGTFYGYLSHTLDDYLGTEIKGELISEAKLARIIASKEIKELPSDAPIVVSTIAREVRARVTIISHTGEVLGDSGVKPTEVKELENHLNRPEVQQALETGYGESLRHSATLRTEMLYVAYPFTSMKGEEGVLRLALPLTSMEATKGRLHGILVFSLVAVTLISLVLSYILSRVASYSVRRIINIAEKFRLGQFTLRVPVTTKDEMGELAEVMNEMADRIEEELASVAAEKNRLDTILRGMGEGLMVTDASGIVTIVNPAFHSLFSIHEEVEGSPLINITRHPALNEAYKAVIRTGTERLEESTLQLDKKKTILTHWVPLMKDEALQGVVAVFHDISEIKRLEKIRADLVANVSHELRTPITVIKGYAETLLDTMPQDEGHAVRFIEIIHAHAERLANLVNDLLALSELESGKLRMELIPITIEGAVKQACNLLEPRAREKDLTIDRNGLTNIPNVLADRGRIEQVLINLIDNAIKYTPENGSVTISAKDEGEFVRVSVTDMGIGIPPKDLPRIFERFYRVDAARSREEGGTGLGLSIVKHIVQLHEGSVSVESALGKGSTFSFTLKRAV